eukprot:CAMPEP_0194066270 /NCGR_PEP_ID=MMETSP0009_2-20130614/85927_1 /TAXON_ID=210454 /ORGANISM="Grammatophora oceanica, Strain CCMP 410" /LENGTH=501 /DNA_ID=CAMNT_0038719201 /DNA_START=162 /DNA_END=1667 /DNA_ORIENTATION=+
MNAPKPNSVSNTSMPSVPRRQLRGEAIPSSSFGAILVQNPTTKITKKKKTRGTKIRKKAPGAPRRFKTAFIFFSITKHKQIREELQNQDAPKRPTTAIAKMVSEAWKNLSKDDRAIWDDLAAKDKARYEIERSLYKGPWQVSNNKQRDPTAPRRPCSAFVSFLHAKRGEVKRENPTASSSEIMKLVAKAWHNSPERIHFLDAEAKQLAQYKEKTKEWKEMQQRKPEVLLATKREQMAWKALESPLPRRKNLFNEDHTSKNSATPMMQREEMPRKALEVGPRRTHSGNEDQALKSDPALRMTPKKEDHEVIPDPAPPSNPAPCFHAVISARLSRPPEDEGADLSGTTNLGSSNRKRQSRRGRGGPHLGRLSHPAPKVPTLPSPEEQDEAFPSNPLASPVLAMQASRSIEIGMRAADRFRYARALKQEELFRQLRASPDILDQPPLDPLNLQLVRLLQQKREEHNFLTNLLERQLASRVATHGRVLPEFPLRRPSSYPSPSLL